MGFNARGGDNRGSGLFHGSSFSIGYHSGPQYRAIGLTGMEQSMLVYPTSAVGSAMISEIFGGITPLALFALLRPSRRPGSRPMSAALAIGELW